MAAVDTAIREQAPVLLSSLALAAPLSKGLIVRRASGVRFERRFVLIHSGEESLPAPARALARHLLEAATPPP